MSIQTTYIGVVIALCVAGFFYWRFRRRGVGGAHEKREGAVADEAGTEVFQALNHILDERYAIFRGLVVPGYKLKLDIVVVGPKGLLMFTVNRFDKAFRFFGGETYLENDADPDHPILLHGESNPVYEMLQARAFLEQHLASVGYPNMTPRCAFVIARGSARTASATPVPVIADISKLGRYISNLNNDERFTPEFKKELTRVFEKLRERP